MKSVTYWPTLSKFRGGLVKKTTLYEPVSPVDTFIENEPVWEEGLCSLEMLRGNDPGNMCNPEHKSGS